jgi:hypothetical protein
VDARGDRLGSVHGELRGERRSLRTKKPFLGDGELVSWDVGELMASW